MMTIHKPIGYPFQLLQYAVMASVANFPEDEALKTSMLKPVFKLLIFVKPYWRPAALALTLLTIQVFLDLAIPRLIQRIIDQGIHGQNQAVVVQTGLLMLGISVFSAFTAIGNNSLSVRVGESVARDLREAIFLKIQSFSFGNLDRLKTGMLLVRLSSDTSAVQRLVQITLRIGTRAPLLMIGSLLLMINTSPSLALAILPILLITSAIIVFFVFKMEPLFRVVQQKLDRLNTVLQENVAGARLVKAFVRADFEAERFEAANADFTAQSTRVMQFMNAMSPTLTVWVNIGMVVVIWAGGLAAIRGELTVGQIVAFTNYLLTTMIPLVMMTLLSNVWANGLASARRINEVLDTAPEVLDAPDALPVPATAPGRVVFEDVSFHYNGQTDEPVLSGLSFTAEPGQTVAFLGATGAGKSTLVNLIPRFYDVTAGRILIDGQDIRAVEQRSLLAQIAVVPQDTVLFTGTVRDNIRYGAPNADETAVVAAAQAAQAHDFILELPQGYDTHLEERGGNLSGGQKQRLAIARALLTQPKILILDDSTSAVDVDTETRIQEALAEQSPRTNLVVAQRISTVLKADKIVVLDKGEIAAEGTHQTLMQSSPIYREIYESQLGNGILNANGRHGSAGLPESDRA
jgi:ATP-binding cassette subfamily B protein